MTAHVGGLDLSTTRIGYAAPNGQLFSVKVPTGAEDPYRRLAQLRDLLVLTIRRNPPLPDLFVIEDYMQGTQFGVMTAIRLGELGGVIRTELHDRGFRFVPVQARDVKRFATGKSNAGHGLKGKAKKQPMIDAAIARGADPRNDDEADAFHLRRMGRIAHGLEPHLFDHELDALDSAGAIW